MTSVIHLHQLAAHALAHERDASSPLQDAVLLVPSADVSVFEIDTGEIPKRYLQQALQPIVEDLVAEDLDDLHISHTVFKKAELLIVFVTRKQTLRQWLDVANASGIRPLAIYADFYSAPYTESNLQLVVRDAYGCARTAAHQGFSGSLDELLNLLPLVGDGRAITIETDAELNLPDTVAATQSLLPATPPYAIYGEPVNLLQGEFAPKQQRQNPYRPYYWPLGLAAAALLSLSINYAVMARHYQSQQQRVNTAVEQDYQRLFGEAPVSGWFNNAQQRSRLARLQINGDKLQHWQLVKLLNDSLNNCRTCQIEELSVSNNIALLSLKESSSQTLVANIAKNPLLQMLSQQKNETIVTLKIALVESRG